MAGGVQDGMALMPSGTCHEVLRVCRGEPGRIQESQALHTRTPHGMCAYTQMFLDIYGGCRVEGGATLAVVVEARMSPREVGSLLPDAAPFRAACFRHEG